IFVRAQERLAKLRQAGFIFLADDELVWISSPIRTHGHRFAAVNNTRAALTETLPAAPHLIRDATGRGAVPTFHRLDGPPIRNRFAIDGESCNRPRERRAVAADDGV